MLIYCCASFSVMLIHNFRFCKNPLGAVLVTGSILLIIAFKKVSKESETTVVNHYEIVKNPLVELDMSTQPAINQSEIESFNIYKICNSDQPAAVLTKGLVPIDIENTRISDTSSNEVKEMIMERG